MGENTGLYIGIGIVVVGIIGALAWFGYYYWYLPYLITQQLSQLTTALGVTGTSNTSTPGTSGTSNTSTPGTSGTPSTSTPGTSGTPNTSACNASACNVDMQDWIVNKYWAFGPGTGTPNGLGSCAGCDTRGFKGPMDVYKGGVWTTYPDRQSAYNAARL